MTVTIRAGKKERLEGVTEYLQQRYVITERLQGNSSCVLTMIDRIDDEIERMFELIYRDTGINVVIAAGRKHKCTMRAKRAASYILRNRFNLSFLKIADRMKCNHATIINQLKDLELKVDVGMEVSIDTAVEIVLMMLKDMPRKKRKRCDSVTV